MSYARNVPIIIQKKDEETEEWNEFLPVHARIIKNKGSEYLKAGAIQNVVEKIFDIRFNSKVREIEYNTSLYRILYANRKFNVIDYDDFNDEHINVKLVGVSYE